MGRVFEDRPPMRVALVGPTLSGKSTLFAALAEAGGSHVHLERPDQPHLAVVKVPDRRLDFLAELYQSKKVTPAEIEFVDLPGFDLSDELGRNRAKAHWPPLRESAMVLLVVREFESDSVPPYRNRLHPESDVKEMLSEMLFADLDQVTVRADKLESALRKPTGRREEQARELELMRRLAATLEAEKPISEAVRDESKAKLIRSFAFVSQKPTLVVRNASEDAMASPSPERTGGVPSLRLSARIEEEIAQLPEADRAAFLADLGLAAPARDRLARECLARMGVVTFLTVGEKEARAWPVPAGTDAFTAAGTIHTDIARGFIRAEVVAYDDLLAAGDMKGAKAAGKVRLEGRNYVVRDGDVIYFRFNA